MLSLFLFYDVFIAPSVRECRREVGIACADSKRG